MFPPSVAPSHAYSISVVAALPLIVHGVFFFIFYPTETSRQIYELEAMTTIL